MNAIKLYSDIKSRNTIFEVWGGSTKHPDIRRILSYDIEENRFCQSTYITSIEYEVFQWTVQCISELSFGSYHILKRFMEACEPYFRNKHKMY